MLHRQFYKGHVTFKQSSAASILHQMVQCKRFIIL